MYGRGEGERRREFGSVMQIGERKDIEGMTGQKIAVLKLKLRETRNEQKNKESDIMNYLTESTWKITLVWNKNKIRSSGIYY